MKSNGIDIQYLDANGNLVEEGDDNSFMRVRLRSCILCVTDLKIACSHPNADLMVNETKKLIKYIRKDQFGPDAVIELEDWREEEKKILVGKLGQRSKQGAATEEQKKAAYDTSISKLFSWYVRLQLKPREKAWADWEGGERYGVDKNFGVDKANVEGKGKEVKKMDQDGDEMGIEKGNLEKNNENEDMGKEKGGDGSDPWDGQENDLLRDRPLPFPSIPHQEDYYPDVDDFTTNFDGPMLPAPQQDSAPQPSPSGPSSVSGPKDPSTPPPRSSLPPPRQPPPPPPHHPSPRPSPSSNPPSPSPPSSPGADEDDEEFGPVDTIIFDDAIVHTREKNAELLAQARARPLRFPSPGTIERVEAAAEKVARRYDRQPAWIDLRSYVTTFEHGADLGRKEVSDLYREKEEQRARDLLAQEQAKTKRLRGQLAKMGEARKAYVAAMEERMSNMKREYEEALGRVAKKAKRASKRAKLSLKHSQRLYNAEERRLGYEITQWSSEESSDDDMDDEKGK
ncbi:hypothetical protein I302_107915 [Kwoniella bestiolae CBS 10118]|uniref:Uncharacterized protein n=1 Tax=Kwoniella bestiolae CBS 10118 TaxID=1296100 RepID=A0A1B9FX72_9TREE|nr:hypothetical protein I302_06345 [Kwoniella bestiolae CBS 10118]OCF23364.1 hypothetical protein I302_06345 [Kwoniella bestiolae CBS 10118]